MMKYNHSHYVIKFIQPITNYVNNDVLFQVPIKDHMVHDGRVQAIDL